MTIRPDADRLRDTLAALVATDSVNPTLVPGGAGEAEIAEVTRARMREAGLDVATFEPAPGRPSVVGRLRGTGDGPTLMLNAHYDTVGVEGMEAPFVPRIEDGRLYGRGAYDMKGALAACIETAAALAESGATRGGVLLVAGVADEEYASLGTADLVERRARGELDFEACVVTEPTSLRLCVAHRGFTWIRVTTAGRAAHGSRYEEGVDANLRMGRVLARLEELLGEHQAGPGHPLLGPPSLHAARLAGGVGLSTYAPECTLEVERRTVPPETLADVEREISGLLDALRAEDPSFEASWSVTFHRDTFETSPEAPIARAAARAAEAVLGESPTVVGDAPWMDSALTSAAGVDTIVFGPHGGGAHADVEWVDLASCLRLAEILGGTALRYWEDGTAADGPR
ncbi:MAG: M20/M25/M40 family metallo-hydrolase [Gemmatimonadota bacterium]|nr:M20/M25/M40 family metallo-hydrolase [Gemmatimonadota bacterium]